MPSIRTRVKAAYTMIELLIAVAVVGVTFATFYACITEGFALCQMSRENLRATELLSQQMEIIRLYTWSQINSNGFVPQTFTAPFSPNSSSTNGPVYSGTILITNAPMTESYVTNNKLVTVSLVWTSYNNVAHSRSMSTLVSQYGLHNYYYH